MKPRAANPLSDVQFNVLRWLCAANQPIVRRSGGHWCVADSVDDVLKPRDWRRGDCSVGIQTVWALEKRGYLARVGRLGKPADVFDDPRVITDEGRRVVLRLAGSVSPLPVIAVRMVDGAPVVAAAPFRPIPCHFADDDTGRDPFHGYTDGRRWNGFECPHLPLPELLRVLAALVEWGDERGYEVIDDERVRVRGAADGDEYVMSAKLRATTDGDRWLFDCGGAWTFVEAVSSDEIAADETAVEVHVPCPHPEHRLGTRGGLRKHQRVCLQCGDVVVVVVSGRARR